MNVEMILHTEIINKMKLGKNIGCKNILPAFSDNNLTVMDRKTVLLPCCLVTVQQQCGVEGCTTAAWQHGMEWCDHMRDVSSNTDCW